MRFLFLLLVKILLIAAIVGGSQSLEFDFPIFFRANGSETGALILANEDSNIEFNSLQVTNDVKDGKLIKDLSGRAVFREKFRLWSTKKGKATFNTTFLINIQNQTDPGGEGLCFILAEDSSVPPNSHGQWLGIVNETTNGSSSSPTRIIAIEFDTRKSFDEDVDSNHVGLDINSINSIRRVSLTSRGITLSDGVNSNHTVHIQYNGTHLSVFVSRGSNEEDDPDMENLVFSEPLDLSNHLPESVFVGFAGSTSSETQLNCVLSWKFNGTNVNEEASKVWIWITVPVVGVSLLSGIFLLLYWVRKCRKQEQEDVYPSIEDQIQGSTLAPRKFKLKELKNATGNFSPRNKLGKGGFGTVYKGVWKDKLIAVKRVSKKSHQGKQEFIAEVTTIGNLNHRNLVKLIGWCYENKDLLLVYEFMPNGSLEKFIFSEAEVEMEEYSPSPQSSIPSSSSSLSWDTRLNVIHGVAQALEYLHNGCEKRVLHRDIKASNIMLDSEFNPKLGDFGLARTIQESQQTHHSTKEIAGTPGYMAPEIFLTGRATVETDVYAFGVLILEVVCGRKPGNQSDPNNYNNSIVYWLWDLYGKGLITDAVDKRLKGQFEEKEMEYVLILGLSCCHPNPNKRPSMKIVLQVLNGEADPPEVPTQRPAFMWPALPPSFHESDYSLPGSQLTPFTEISGR